MKRWLAPADALLQQAAWWIVVLGAARGRAGFAAAVAGAVVALHLLLRPAERRHVASTAAAAGAWGLVTDSLLVHAGVIGFGGGAASPAWMVGLWSAFGAGLTASLRTFAAWPAPRLALAAALAGPFAYRAGAALGAIELSAPTATVLMAVAAQWGVGVPLLAGVARWAAQPPRLLAPADATLAHADAGPGSAAERRRWRWQR